jgi:hypothetical protein
LSTLERGVTLENGRGTSFGVAVIRKVYNPYINP